MEEDWLHGKLWVMPLGERWPTACVVLYASYVVSGKPSSTGCTPFLTLFNNRTRMSEGSCRRCGAMNTKDDFGLLCSPGIGQYVHRTESNEADSCSHMAVILGRPRSINLSDCTTKAPVECDMPENPSNFLPIPSDRDEKPSSYAVRLFSYTLGLHIHEMLSLGANKRHVRDYGLVQSLNVKVEDLLLNMHPALRPQYPDTSWDEQFTWIPKQREHAKILANSFLLALHREHALKHDQSFHAAINAALASLAAQDRLYSALQPHQSKLYVLSCHGIDASIFLGYILMQQQHAPINQETRARALESLRKAIGRLELMQESSSLAKGGLQILSRVLQKVETGPGGDGDVRADQMSLGGSQLPPAPDAITPSYANFDPSVVDRFHPDLFEAWDFPDANDQIMFEEFLR